MKKQEVLDRVLNSESSIFSKDDVVRLIEMVEMYDLTGKSITVSDISDALDKALSEISHKSDDAIDRRSVEFELSGNEIYIESIDFDIDFIRDTLEEYLMPLGEPDPEE